MPIRLKMLLSFMAMVALIVALIVFALVSSRIMADGARRLMHVQQKEALIADLQTTVDRAVTALGGYLLSGREAQRTTFIQLVVFSRRQLAALERTAAADAGGGALERRKIAELRAEIDRIEENAREVILLADRIEKGRGQEIVRDVIGTVKSALDRRKAPEGGERTPGDLRSLGALLGVSTRDAQERLEEIEALSRLVSESEARLRELSMRLVESKDRALEIIGDIREHAQREGVVAVEIAAAADGRAWKYLLVGAVITLACGLSLALYLSRSLSRPIVALGRGARLIGGGDFDHRIELETGDELEDLAGRFNAMAARLKESYAGLEERVRERTRELEEAGLRLRRLFDGITDGITVIDRRHRIVDSNTGIASMAGADGRRLAGRACHEAYNGSPEPCPGCPAADTFRNGAASSGEIRWSPPGGKPRDMEIYTFPLVEEKGKVMHVIEYAKDVSDRKALERKLFQSAKLAGIGTLAAGVAHEIRNPLGIMKTSADMIRRGSRDGEQNFELAQFMVEEIERLNRVVTRLLEFARPSAPKVESCDLHEILDRALALVGPQHRLGNLEIARDYAAGLPHIPGDREQLCQLFLNLIINAAQAMPGGGRLTLSTGFEGTGAVRVGVADTGEGIDEKILDNIFDPFFSTKEDGSGLGLAIAFRIAEAHRGRIEARSTRGEGTVFTVILPAA
ncbi:MAG: ATP-binding protein [bacterium]|nr:ATP-binding protein [bacterium]